MIIYCYSGRFSENDFSDMTEYTPKTPQTLRLKKIAEYGNLLKVAAYKTGVTQKFYFALAMNTKKWKCRENAIYNRAKSKQI